MSGTEELLSPPRHGENGHGLPGRTASRVIRLRAAEHYAESGSVDWKLLGPDGVVEVGGEKGGEGVMELVLKWRSGRERAARCGPGRGRSAYSAV